MKKELQFISDCFNINYRDKSKEDLENIIEKGLDWDFIFKKIFQSDIAPLAYHNLSGLKNNKIPDWFLENLDNCYNYTVVKNLFICNALNNLLNLFSKEKISVIALKGMFMLDIIYENIALRNLIDIDILVKKTDLQQVERLLQQNGYIKVKEYAGEISYLKDSNVTQTGFKKILIEIHYGSNLPPPLSITTDFLWHNTTKKDTNGLLILYPSLENSLIYAALHFFHHFSEAFICQCAFPQLKSILDIHEIISKKQEAINWDYILDFCKRNKVRYIIYLSMYLSELYFVTSIPKAFMDKIRPSFFRRKVLQAFLNNYIDIQASKVEWKTLRIIKCIYYSLLEKPYFRRRFFYSVSEFAKENHLLYPSFLAFFLYAIRPFLWLNMLIYLKNVNKRNHSHIQ